VTDGVCVKEGVIVWLTVCVPDGERDWVGVDVELAVRLVVGLALVVWV